MNPLDFLFPKDLYCISCGRPLPVGCSGWNAETIALCETCSDEIIWATGRSCAKCGRPLSAKTPTDLCRSCTDDAAHLYRKGIACALYAGRVSELIRDMKYHEKSWYAETLSALMAARFFAAADPETGELPCYDYLAAVPMSAVKRSARGYDQAALLAKGLSRRIGIPYVKDALTRVRETDVMSALSADERRQNLADAFAVSCDMIAAGKRFLLADDVYTTGSSVDACAQTLLAVGAKSVDVIVFAIGADNPVRRA